MKRQLAIATLTMLAVVLVASAGARAVGREDQQPAPAKAPPQVLKVDVLMSRFQGDKKTSSLPFTLWVNADGNPVSLRMGVDVPIGASTITSGNEVSAPSGRSSQTTATTSTKVDYRNVGTSIDCWASAQPDGRYQVDLRVQDSAIFTSDADAKAPVKIADPMAFRTFSFSNRLLMRDGQTVPFATATDRITGEVLKVDVTVAVVK
jgi:hypothetical protein